VQIYILTPISFFGSADTALAVLAEITDGRILVVEYKGADRWDTPDSEEKRNIGNLWAARSNGRCVFSMPKDPDWPALSAAIGSLA
jgi:type III restriction enzyme